MSATAPRLPQLIVGRGILGTRDAPVGDTLESILHHVVLHLDPLSEMDEEFCRDQNVLVATLLNNAPSPTQT
jgi:hypothetical protein